jgi:TolB-like protein/Tfp pilus assembly protein PilF
MSTTTEFVRELRRRKVFSTAALYVIAAWIALQVADLAFPGLHIPEDAIRYVWIGAFLGFPLAVLFGWMYQVTQHGIVRTGPADAGETSERSLRKSDYVLLTAMVAVAGTITFAMLDEIRDAERIDPSAPVARKIHANSLAVLPLANLTGDPDQEYFVDGMHEALISVLSKVGELRVTSRTSANVYRTISKSVPDIGRELGVANILEGSVLRAGDSVRITLQLINAVTDEHLWAENYERDLKDVLSLQAEVALAVAERIRIKLTPDEETRLTGREVDPETYRAYLKGTFYLNKFTPEGFARGMAYLHEAVENDPGDPLAYAGLARGYSLIGHSTNPTPDAWARAKEAATKAVLLDDDLAEGHTALAEIKLYYDWDWAGAEESFKRAIELNPSQDWAHAHYGWYLQLIGDMDRAIEEMKQAQEIGPLMPLWSVWLGWLYRGTDDLDDALAQAQKSLELAPDFPWGLYTLGSVYADKEMFDEALSTFERLRPINPNMANVGFATTYALTGRREEALKNIAELAINPGQKDLIVIGRVHALLGNKTEALNWLEAAHEAHTDWFPWIISRGGSRDSNALDILSDEPRYQALIAKLGLPQQGLDN